LLLLAQLLGGMGGSPGLTGIMGGGGIPTPEWQQIQQNAALLVAPAVGPGARGLISGGGIGRPVPPLVRTL